MKHTEGFLAVVNDAKSRIRELTVAETQQRLEQNADAKLIDVREDNEWRIAHHHAGQIVGRHPEGRPSRLN